MTTDVKKIAQNTGFTEQEIYEIKQFVFMEKHVLDKGEPEFFYASYEIAESWQRLIEGTNIQDHDLTLLRHEIMERALMLNGMSQDEAHIKTSRVYDYAGEARKFYGKIKKHS